MFNKLNFSVSVERAIPFEHMMYEHLQKWGPRKQEVKFFLRHEDSPTESSDQGACGWKSPLCGGLHSLSLWEGVEGGVECCRGNSGHLFRMAARLWTLVFRALPSVFNKRFLNRASVVSAVVTFGTKFSKLELEMWFVGLKEEKELLDPNDNIASECLNSNKYGDLKQIIT